VNIAGIAAGDRYLIGNPSSHAFGHKASFVIERFGMFMHVMLRAGEGPLQRGASF
jgi:hypothetical protein